MNRRRLLPPGERRRPFIYLDTLSCRCMECFDEVVPDPDVRETFRVVVESRMTPMVRKDVVNALVEALEEIEEAMEALSGPALATMAIARIREMREEDQTDD